MIFRRTFHDETTKTKDARNIDPQSGILSGEGAHQKVKNIDSAFPTTHEVLKAIPDEAIGEARDHYYGRPAIKEPVWIWAVPAYFYVGGVAGAAGVLAGAAQVAGGEPLRPLVRRLRWISTAGGALGSVLLIYDLGRPERFYNMLRVFRPTSPMNVGAWLLAGAASMSGAAAVLGELRVRRLADLAGLGSAVFNLPFAGYTAVLVCTSAVPVWQSTRRTLPLLFIASAGASLASILQLLSLPERERKVVRRFGMVTKLAELAAGSAVELEASRVAEVARPLHEGTSGKLWKAGKVLAAAGLAVSLLPDRFKWARTAAGLLGTAAALSTRFAVLEAGRASARNPHATFRSQRARLGAAEVGPASTNLVQLKVDGVPVG